MRYPCALGAAFGSVLLAAFLVGAATAATAQTLTDPNPRPNSPRPAAAKATAAKHMKACPEFGSGFYRVDGTDTCVKLGGFVDVGVSSH
jgi:Porin subfamily